MKNETLLNNKSSEKKLICFICNGFPTISETFVIRQIANAVNNGFEIAVHADYLNLIDKPLLEHDPEIKYMLSKSYTSHPVPDNIFKRFFLAISLANNQSCFTALLNAINPFQFGIRALNLRRFFSFSSFLGKQNPYLVHAQFGPNGVKAVDAKLCGVIRSPILTSFHGYDTNIAYADLNKLKRHYSRLFLHGDIFLVNGDYLKNKLLSLGCPADKIVKLPLGVDLDVFKPSGSKPGISAQGVKLITIGRLIKLKNQEFGINLVNLLRNRGIYANYTIIGDGPEADNLKKLAKDLGVQNHVHFEGSQSPQIIQEILPKHHIFLMTSFKDEFGRMETQGIVSAEAQACGLPVITLGFGGTGDTIQHGVTGYDISSSDPEAAVEYINKLLEPDVYQSFSIQARNFIAENYNIKTTNQSLIDLYKNLVNSQHQAC